MAKYRVEVDRAVCVSTGSCYTMDNTHFESDKNQKSQIVGGQTDDSKSTHIFDDDLLARAKEAAEACPVSAIKITEL